MKPKTAVLCVFGLWFGVAGCKEQLPRVPIAVPSSPQALQGAPGRTAMSKPRSKGRTDGVAGLRWKVPAGWARGGRRPMRKFTYFIAGAAGRIECSVSHFGPIGGGLAANLSRWRGQFRPLKKSKRSSKTLGSIKVEMIRLEGTYMFSRRPMSPNKTPKPNWSMLGAIAQGTRGPVFFKCWGPTASMKPGQFQQMIDSIKP